MFIPLGTDRPRKRPTLIVYILLVLNAAAFLLQSVLGHWNVEWEARLYETFMFFPDQPTLWGLLGYQFLHGDFLHLAFNMLFLWVFGPPVEDRFGRFGFLLFYLVGGVAAAGLHGAFEPAPILGASGSISGVTGAFLVLFPLTHIRLLLFFLIIGVFSIPAWWFIAFAIAKDLVFQGMGGGGVAYLAHLGGYVYGAGVAATLLWLKVIPRETYDLFSMGRQAHRRRRFRELARKNTGGLWAGEAPAGRVARKGRPSKDEEAQSRCRKEIGEALAAEDIGAAARSYIALLERQPSAVVARDAQMLIANHLFSSGDHTNAATAYEGFLRRFRTDAEADHIRLMLALLNARYLNDPIRSGQLLREIRDEGLDASSRDLAASLREEIGEGGGS